jgi:hypothetical protein
MGEPFRHLQNVQDLVEEMFSECLQDIDNNNSTRGSF